MSPDIAEGTVVDGRYRISYRIGAGGMAEVYCAEDMQLGRKVALKLLHRRFAQDAEFVERFRREASAAAGLQHPNVVGVYDRGEWGDTYFIAMEHLAGRSLKQVIQEEAPLPPERAIDLAIQVLKAARFAHKRGIIHRDLKPHNVIVEDEGRARVTDFGIARAGASDMTETGSIMGTAQYLSPEQAQGHAVSETSDLYSVGVILYEMLTGRVPFDAESAVTIALKQVSEAPVPPRELNPSIPLELEQIVLRALDKDPAGRYPDAGTFIADLERVREGLAPVAAGQATTAFAAAAVPGTEATQLAASSAPPPPLVPPEEVFVHPGEPLPPEPEREGRRWWVLVLVALLVAGGLLAALLLTRPDQVTVANAVGRDDTTAVALLQNQGLDPDVERVTSDAPRGRVIRQDPQPGEEVDEGSQVSLTVSAGPGEAPIPTVTGQSRRAARRALERAGFDVKVEREASDGVPDGRAIRTAPPEGSQLEKGSTVTLFVSSGPEQVAVPDVRGKSRTDAEDAIEEAGLTADVTRREDEDADPGTVLSQDPAPGTEVDEGSAVNIVVARAPREVAVPNVRGDTRNEAANAISDAGLRPFFEEEEVDNPDQDDVVLDQDPGSGERVKRGSRVTIVVGDFNPDLNPEGDTTGP